MIDLASYDPKCECGWYIPDDVFYQIKDGEIYELDYDVPTHSPVPKFTDIKVYPIWDATTVDHWTETHFCPKCNKEYVYVIPMEKE